MKKILMIAVACVAQSAQPASMAGSKTAVTAVVPTNTAASAAAATAKSPDTIMKSIAWLQEHGGHERYCNTVIAMRGMIRNHPTLAVNFLHKPSPVPTSNPEDYCYVANAILGGRTDMYYVQIAAESLKQTPLTTPAGCDGTACRKLLDNAQKYLIGYYCECWFPHGPTEHCSCRCNMQPGNGHNSEKCPKEKTAILYIDKLMVRDLATRKQRIADAQQRKQQQAADDKWLEEAEKFVKSIKPLDAAISATAKK